jgi:ribosome maturation protein SDO1
MSRMTITPSNQVRLTNVAVVRMHRAGKRFELACYRNKILDYRSGQETDLSEVLQTDRIFANVSKGEFASAKDLQRAFPSMEAHDRIVYILKHGTVQVSSLERELTQETTLAQIATWAAANCVHSQTKRPYAAAQLLGPLRSFPLGANTSNNVKQSCLAAVKYLQSVNFPIERARMQVSLEYAVQQDDAVQAALQHMRPAPCIVTTERVVAANNMEHDDDDTNANKKLILQVDPSLYRELDQLVKSLSGRLEIQQQVVVSVQQEQSNDATEEADVMAQQVPVSGSDTSKMDAVAINNDYRATATTKAIATQLDTLHLSPAVDMDDADDKSHHSNASTTSNSNNYNESLLPLTRKQLKAKKKRSSKLQVAPSGIEANSTTNSSLQHDDDTIPKSLVKDTTTTTQTSNHADDANNNNNSTSKSCNTCGGSFANTADYRAHYRSDWHRYNQTLLLKGIAAVSEREFQLCDQESFFGTNNDKY